MIGTEISIVRIFHRLFNIFLFVLLQISSKSYIISNIIVVSATVIGKNQNCWLKRAKNEKSFENIYFDRVLFFPNVHPPITDQRN